MFVHVLQGHPPYAPYCGAPPEPWRLLSRWNLDPALLTVLALALLSYLAVGATRSREAWPAPWRQQCFVAGWAVGALALISPLCALSVSLFSARLGQHMILETIAAPLIALGLPSRTLDRATPIEAVGPPHHGELLAAAIFGATLWFWHTPGPYAATFDGAGYYWLMHLTAFASALWLWRVALSARGDRLGGFVAAMWGTSAQMGFLGALLTFSDRPFYGVHVLTTQAWGLSPLEDQQLGGVIMWVPTLAIFLAAILTVMALALRRPEPHAMWRSPT